MNVERFREELALVQRLDRVEDLPAPLLEAARRSEECWRAAEERVRCDRLLDEAPGIEPAEGSAAAIVAAALAAEQRARAGRRAPRLLRPWTALAAAALVVVSLGAGYLLQRGEGPAQSVDPEVLAQLDLLLDWDLLNEHGADLDLLASNDLADALSDIEAEEEGVPR